MSTKPITLEYEYTIDMQELVKQIAECEGVHTQQAVFSTFHGALTQVCYGCLKVRSTIRRELNNQSKGGKPQ